MTFIPKQDLRVNRDDEGLLHRITNRIRRTLEFEEIITVSAAEVLSLLGTDRVMIYKFHPDGSGQVIAESIYENRLPSLLGLNFPADDIPADARELFIKSRVRSVVNVDTQEIGHTSLRDLQTGEIISEDICYRPVDPCHLEYMNAMGVKSSLVTPILHQDQLWGLLVSHNSETRSVTEQELQAVQMVVDHLSVAIAQSNLFTKAQQKAAKEAIINRIATELHSLSAIELKSALEETVAAFSGSGGRLCIRNQLFNLHSRTFRSLADCLQAGRDGIKLYTCGVQPVIPELAKDPLIEQDSLWQEHYQSGEYDVWAIADIYQDSSWRNLQVAFRSTKIRSVLVIPLHYRQELLGYLSIFRDEIDTETLWAGRFDPDQRQLYPRLSFEVWRESKTAQAREWSAEEIELAQELGKQFALGIQQYQLYQQVNAFNANLEYQVQERTSKLQQATEQQRILFEVVAKMRQSLDIDTIFRTTCREVRLALNADRVGFYRFEPGANFNQGEIVAEDVLPGFVSALGVKISDRTFADNYATKYQLGRVNAVSDIHNALLQECHIALLDQFQVKANITAPVMEGDHLWGLLCIHQCSQTREWQTSEIQFVTQIAAQMSVAREQAELLNQTKEQSQKITQALRDLKATQTQLVQTEKMSSLGQLVAGIAHEINNPVNFIYGNLVHVNEYAEDLLSMLELYQQQGPTSPDIYERAVEIDLEFISQDLPKTLSSMKVGVDRIRQIVSGLRNFSRLDEAEVKAVDIHEGIDSTLLILQHRFKARPDSPSIHLVKEYGELPLVECYAGQLNQVFMNVLSNAIDALEHHKDSKLEHHQSQITINTAVGELKGNVKSAVIRITDNGSGIPKAVRSQVFDPFFTTKPIGKGTGLGLSISYQIIVEKHGGVLKCDSQPGLGTQFWIEIPISQPPKLQSKLTKSSTKF